MKLLPLLMGAGIVLLSCENKNSAITESQKANAASPVEAPQPASAAATEEAATVVAAEKPTGKPALNPPHGEPFHRCDIEVGAPIDSAPQAAVSQPIAPQVVAPQGGEAVGFNTNPIAPSTPKPALNPPHGEPHHRCDLQVGAPLT